MSFARRGGRGQPSLRRLWVCLLCLAVVAGAIGHRTLPTVAADDSKSLRAERFDIRLEIQPNSDLLVTETQKVTVTEGSFSQGFREIPLARVERIADVSVSEPNQPYRQAESGVYTFLVDENSKRVRVDWQYPFTRSGTTRTFIVSYRAIGALRFYEGGDQLYWQAVFADRGYPVDAATVTVKLPADVQPQDLKLAAYPESLQAETQVVDSRTVVFAVQSLEAGTGLEVRVQFPHGLVSGSPPSWQAQADQEEWIAQHVKPIINLFVLALAAFLLLGGLLGVLLLWHSRGRDPQVGTVPLELSKPPSELEPGLARTLVDEHAGIREAIATMIDLARRGYLRIIEGEASENGDFSLQLLKRPPPGLQPYETLLIREVFEDGDSASLQDLRPRLPRILSRVQALLHAQVTELGFFPQNPSTVRLRYAVAGGLVAAAAAALGALCTALFSLWTDLAFAPFVSIGIVGIVMVAASTSMPRHTAKGALEAARWKAFARFLTHVERETDLGQVRELFDRYLPYAVAFGLDKQWVAKFATVETPAPTWYVPFPSAHAQRGQQHYEGEAIGAGKASVTGSGLQQLSDHGALSLQSISDSLLTMLNATAASFSPPSKSGSGGGGWSGGGAGGGGGGGGGSGGFS